MHQIHYDRLITLQVVLPRVFSIFFVIEAFRFYLRDDWLVLHTVEVLMETVEHKVQELLRILLLKVIKL